MKTNVIQTDHANGWGKAYLAFLKSRNENLILKIAPLLLLFGSPEIVLSNIIPIAGEVIDVGGVSLTLLVLVRTFMAVRKYR